MNDQPEPSTGEPTPAEGASVTLEDVQADPQLSSFIASADRVMDAIGFTEHGFRHANLVARIAYQVLHRLNFTEREAELARVAGYLHDVGNMLTREVHAQTGGLLVYQALRERAEEWPSDLLGIAGAIVTINGSGGLRVERGLIRPEDKKALAEIEAGS